MSRRGPEAAWQEQLVDLAHVYGWRVSHFRTAQQGGRYLTPVGADGKGWPDLVCVRERILFVEVKAATGVLGPEQKAWRDAIQSAGGEWYVWRPRDWDAIVETLKPRRA